MQALTLDEAWEKYSPVPAEAVHSASVSPVAFPGRVLGEVTQDRLRSFHYNWAYRTNTYELHYISSVSLASGVYGLALHAQDIDTSLPKEKFVHGVLGYHYTVEQVCTWANDVLASDKAFPAEEVAFLSLLLSDNILAVRDGRFIVTGVAGHIAAAAPGRKRSFEQNLRHERLHILWDEDAAFTQGMHDKWNNLSSQEKSDIKTVLHQYAKNNELQLIEEWAIKEAEKQDILR